MNLLRKRKLALFPVFCLLILFLLAGNVQAMMIELSTEELVEGSDAIIVGTVKSISSEWNADQTNIYTTVTVSVEEDIDGGLQSQEVLLVVSGGEVGEVAQVVSIAPIFNVGEEVVLFLRNFTAETALLPGVNAAQFTEPAYTVFGHFQGKIVDGQVNGLSLSEYVEEVSRIAGGEASGLEKAKAEEDQVIYNESFFVYNGQKWFGVSPTVLYKVNTTGGPIGTLAAIQNAANTWSNAGANFSFSYDGTHSRDDEAHYYNGINEITWTNLGGPGEALAYAIWWFTPATGQIHEADMVFNTWYSWSTTGGTYDVRTVALHEFGHWLSLGHSDIEDAIMYAYYKGIQHTLHADDIAGIRHIYGEDDFEAELVASFTSGTWLYDHPSRWQRLTSSTAHFLTYSNLALFGDPMLFASYNSGIWYLDSGDGSWYRITSSPAVALSGRDWGWLAASFPSGTWIYDVWNGDWYRITSSTAHALAWVDSTWDGNADSLICSFNSGTWILKNPFYGTPMMPMPDSADLRFPVDAGAAADGYDWHRITSSRASVISSAPDAYAYMSFPSGTWRYDVLFGNFTHRVTSSTANAITVAELSGVRLDVVFSFPSGVWYLEGAAGGGFSISGDRERAGHLDADAASSSWVRITSSPARALHMADGYTY